MEEGNGVGDGRRGGGGGEREGEEFGQQREGEVPGSVFDEVGVELAEVGDGGGGEEERLVVAELGGGRFGRGGD